MTRLNKYSTYNLQKNDVPPSAARPYQTSDFVIHNPGSLFSTQTGWVSRLAALHSKEKKMCFVGLRKHFFSSHTDYCNEQNQDYYSATNLQNKTRNFTSNYCILFHYVNYAVWMLKQPWVQHFLIVPGPLESTNTDCLGPGGVTQELDLHDDSSNRAPYQVEIINDDVYWQGSKIQDGQEKLKIFGTLFHYIWLT